MREHFVDKAPNGSCLVLQAPFKANNAVFGGIMLARSLHKNLSGLLTNGRVRDVPELLARQRDFPVFAQGTSCMAPKPFTQVASLGEPVCLHGVRIATGDMVIADCHGVMIFDPKLLERVLPVAEEIKAMEDRIMGDISQGKGFLETITKHKRF